MQFVKNTFSKWAFVSAVAATASVCSVTATRADIITTLVGAPVPSGSNYLWTYDATLSFNSMLAPNMGLPEFFTVYDFGTKPVVQGITGDLLADFSTPSIDLTDPVAYKVLPTDSASLYNVRFTYTGTATLEGAPYTVTIGSTPVTIGTNLLDLGQFTVVSPTNISAPTFYDGQSFSSTTVTTPQGNVGQTQVPTSAVPEPASLGLLAIGSAGLLGRRRRA